MKTNLKNSIFLVHFFVGFGSFLTQNPCWAQQTGQSFYHSYTPREYQSASQVWSIIQDKRGLMYFGCGEGVLEYDGVNWRKIFTADKGFARDFTMGSDGKIYVSTDREMGYLASDSVGNTIYQSLIPLLSDSTIQFESVWQVNATTNYIYYSDYNAIFEYSPVTKTFNIYRTAPEQSFYGGFVYQDTYFVRQRKKGLVKIENQNLVPAPQSDFFLDSLIFGTSTQYDTSTFLIPDFYTSKLYLYKPDSNRKPSLFSTTDPFFFKDNTIYTATKFKEDYYALGSLKSGVLLINKAGEALRKFDETNELLSNTVYNVESDKTSNIWIGQGNGITKTESGLDLTFWNKKNGLKGTVHDIIRFDDKIYVATGVKVFYLDKDNHLQEVNNIPAGQNWCLYEAQTGRSFLAGTHNGIYEISGNKAVMVYKGLHAFKIVASLNNPNRIYSTSYNDFISLIFEKGKWISEGKWPGISDQIRGIVEDENGEIWLGTRRNGVIRITPVYDNLSLKPNTDTVYTSPFGMKYRLKYYKESGGFNSIIYISPYKINNQIIWRTQTGPMKYNSQTDLFEPWNELASGLSEDNTYAYFFRQTDDGKIWVGTETKNNNDFGYLEPTPENTYNWFFQPFRRLPDMSIEALYVEPSGVVWIGGDEGLFRYDRSKDPKNYNQEYNCLVRRVTINKDSVIFGGTMPENIHNILNYKLEYKFNSIKFEFAAPFFDKEQKTMYSYQLIGFDTTWSIFSNHTEREFTNLNEGTYTFKVKAQNIYDVQSRVATFTFTILPPWHRTWWAYSAYALLASVFMFVIAKLYSRRILAQKKQLEQIVEKRTKEIVQQKEEIHAQAEQLRTTNEKLLELDNFKQSLTSMIVHDLKNPLNGILNISKSYTPEKQVEQMKQSGKQMLTMVLNILDVNKYQHNQMTVDKSPVLLTEIAAAAITDIQFLTEQKNLTINNTIPTTIAVQADREIIERVFTNLLTNAIKYTPNNGTISLHAEVSQQAPHHVKISVTDTGQGIPQDKLHLVFARFGQVSAKKSGSVRSTGLGLTFCKMAVEAHRGTIEVNSEVGKGTTFTFTLPLSHINAEPAQQLPVTENQTQNYSLTEKQKQYLTPFVHQFGQTEIYKILKLRKILKQIDEENPNILHWKNQIQQAIQSGNQKKYDELLNM